MRWVSEYSSVDVGFGVWRVVVPHAGAALWFVAVAAWV